jgi:tryptophan synthase beta subunit
MLTYADVCWVCVLTEGIIPALEPSHAIYHGMQLAKGMKKDEIVLINCCGRGDKDMITGHLLLLLPQLNHAIN